MAPYGFSWPHDLCCEIVDSFAATNAARSQVCLVTFPRYYLHVFDMLPSFIATALFYNYLVAAIFQAWEKLFFNTDFDA